MELYDGKIKTIYDNISQKYLDTVFDIVDTDRWNEAGDLKTDLVFFRSFVNKFKTCNSGFKVMPTIKSITYERFTDKLWDMARFNGEDQDTLYKIILTFDVTYSLMHELYEYLFPDGNKGCEVSAEKEKEFKEDFDAWSKVLKYLVGIDLINYLGYFIGSDYALDKILSIIGKDEDL